ncbi:MAG: helix-turn-helix domain-containing protein [Oscillospiraceae bacterium]|jgi:transcriptional regulator with XRE-family HTH domain|nr:helix-turn-helix domain-containing protein [Oscillospiraceae bacterium]
MELGKKIRQLRFKAGLTQENLAEQLGLGPQAVSKWETGAALPDITLLPKLAEIFGVSIDELFDLSAEQRLNRIENSLDNEKTLPQELFREYEDFLKDQLQDETHQKRATELLAYLYWHRMYSDAGKVRRWAKEAIRRAPGEKNCQYLLQMAEGHACWDWNFANHHKAVDFYRELVEANPDEALPYAYLFDNLLADHRADEAEALLARYARMPGVNPVHVGIYRAHIALARFDEPTADRIVEELGRQYPDDFVWLFEAAQYYAAKCDYDRAITLYERSFEREPRRPRFQDELMAIADIWEIRGDYAKAAETYGRIVDLLEKEWGFTEELELQTAKAELARLREKA